MKTKLFRTLVDPDHPEQGEYVLLREGAMLILECRDNEGELQMAPIAQSGISGVMHFAILDWALEKADTDRIHAGYVAAEKRRSLRKIKGFQKSEGVEIHE